MAQREQLTNEQRRLLRIIARMPLASAANLAPILGLAEDRVRRMLGTLRSGGWVESVVRGMTERRQHRWFLTRKGRGRCSTSPTTSTPSPGRKHGPRGWPLSTPRGNCRRTTGSGSHWTTTIPPTWRTRATSPFRRR